MMRANCALTLFLSLLFFSVEAQDSIFYSGAFRFGKNMAVASCVQPKSDGFLLIEASDDERTTVHVIQYDSQGRLLNEYHHTLAARLCFQSFLY
jgi:hypothetical protein